MVTVGATGNNADSSTGYGAVAYTYQIGKYEVTNAQYAAFLNAVGVTNQSESDPHGLFNGNMINDLLNGGIEWVGVSSGGQGFSGDDRPVNFVSFYSAARFCNWLTMGDTETGIYTFDENGALFSIAGHENASGWALPSENEWYKAAYYDTYGNDGYRTYPTQSDMVETAFANYNTTALVQVGSLEHPSYSGTYDQAGNVWEWNDTGGTGTYGLRGGGFDSISEDSFNSETRYDYAATSEEDRIGFRVVYLGVVPEPQTYALFGGMALLGLTILRRRNK